MVLRLVLASLFVTVTAYAQAPGEMETAGPSEVAPIVVASPCHAGFADVMANRWAVGLSVGALSLAQRDSGNDLAQFNIGQLSLRYRATLHLELELALGGGNEQLQDGTQGDRQVSVGALNLRYRFRPQAAWNWWLMGGLGVVSITEQDATAQDRQDAQRPFMDLGIGIERRFHRFALHAELSALSVGPMRSSSSSEALPVAQPQPMSGAAAVGQSSQPNQPPMTGVDNLAGAQLTIGASYYF